MNRRPPHPPSTAVTPWLDGRLKPSREGVYERRASLRFACWDGRGWRQPAASPARAALQSGAAAHQHVAWRGRAEAADAPCPTCRGHTVLDRGWDAELRIDLIDECPDC